MNKRTLLLLTAMFLVGVVMIGDQFGLLAFLDESGSEHAAAMDKVSQQIDLANDIIEKGALADDKLTAFEKRSLPYDPEIARSEYQNWLSNLVEKNNLTQSSVDVGMPASVTVTDGGKRKEAYKRYVFTVNGAGRLEQATQFLFDFYQGGHLQKISTLRLVPASSRQFTMTITGEAIGIPSCDRKSQLSDEVGVQLARNGIKDYAGIVRRNIFSREAGATLKLITLSSVTFDKSGLPEAWFKVGRERKSKKLQRGEKFSISVHEIEIIDIQPRSVLVAVDGNIVDIKQGESLQEALIALGFAAG